MNTVSQRIRGLVKQSGFKSIDIARKTGIPPENISRYLNGKRLPKGKYLLRLSTFFKVSPAWLLTGEGEMYVGSGSSGGNIIQKPRDEKYSPPENKDFKKLEEETEVWKELAEERKERIAELKGEIVRLKSTASGDSPVKQAVKVGFDISAAAKNSSRK